MINPPIKYAIYGGTRLAMILGHADENIWNWFYSNHIGLYYNERILSHGTYDHRVQFCSFKDNSHKLFVEEEIIRDIDIEGKKVDLCKAWIDSGYYVQPYVDVVYLDNTSYQMENAAHSIFIYGYQEESKSFTILDYDKDRNFSAIQIAEDKLEKAFNSIGMKNDLVKKGWANSFYAKKYKIKKNDYPLDLCRIDKQLNEYIHGDMIKMDMPVLPEYKIKYGIDVYESLAAYLCSKEDDEEIDDRCFKALQEHKDVMYDRFLYMRKKGIIFEDVCMDYFLQIKRSADMLFMLVLKYNMKKKHRILEDILALLEDIKAKERQAIEMYLGVKRW